MRLPNPVRDDETVKIEADPARLQDVRDWASDVAAAAGVDAAGCFEVKLAMSEAVANAISHGTPEPGGTIEIEAARRGGALVFEVTDTGTFVAPLARATAEDEGGRGLELLSLMMDEVRLTSNGDGSRVRFAKRLGE